MYRKDYWPIGHYRDNMIKYECHDCEKTFIIGEEMKKDCPPGYPVCPYCGQSNVEWTVWTTDENLQEFEENGIGCIGLSVEKEQSTPLDWDEAEKHLNTMVEAYEEIPTGIFALRISIYPIKNRFKQGERTKELYDDIMAIR